MKGERSQVLKWLAISLILAGMIFIVLPFWPAIKYYLFPEKISTTAQELVRIANSPSPEPYEPTPIPLTPSVSSSPLPEEPLIVIPKIGLEAKIVPDLSWDNLMAGVGIDPASGKPGEELCVLYGHRFLNWVDPSTGYFYLLDKLEPGDVVVIYWEGKVYRYVTKESKVIEPTDFSIYNPRKTPTLILVTCTPLWTDKYRLVVIAELTRQEQSTIFPQN